jgi:dTDP-4-dehydrorhamnose reductase
MMAGQLAADGAKSGTHHFSAQPDVSWADFAREIMAGAGLALHDPGYSIVCLPNPSPHDR